MLSETRLRLDAIHFVRALRERWVAVPAAELRRFRIHLKGQQGIFKPAGLSDPLSMTTTISSAYTHDTIEGSCVYYDFVPRSREHENDGLKRCAEAALPLIYFLQVKARPAEHVLFAPVYVIGWDDERRRFLVDLSEQRPDEFVTPPRALKQLQLPQIRTPESPREIRELTTRRWQPRGNDPFAARKSGIRSAGVPPAGTAALRVGMTPLGCAAPYSRHTSAQAPRSRSG